MVQVAIVIQIEGKDVRVPVVAEGIPCGIPTGELGAVVVLVKSQFGDQGPVKQFSLWLHNPALVRSTTSWPTPVRRTVQRPP